MRVLGAFLLLLCLAHASWGAAFGSSARGTTTASFLKLGVGARAVSMGEAYSAVADEASALYWNPAALIRIGNRSAMLMHAAYIDSGFFNYAAYGQNLGKLGAFGVGAQYLSMGKMSQTDETGGEVASFTPSDLAVSLGYACEIRNLDPISLLKGFSLGLSAKFIRSTIVDSAKTWAVDGGILSPNYVADKLRLALVLANVGGKVKFEREPEDLPLSLKIGAAYKADEQWLLSAEVGAPRDNRPYVALGTEYLWALGQGLRVAGRAGFNSRTLGDLPGFNSISFGLGFMHQKASLDYGLVPFGHVGLVHRISLSFNF